MNFNGLPIHSIVPKPAVVVAAAAAAAIAIEWYNSCCFTALRVPLFVRAKEQAIEAYEALEMKRASARIQIHQEMGLHNHLCKDS